MLRWGNGGVKTDSASIFDGTIKSLSQVYQTDPDSPFKGLRYKSRLRYANRLEVIETALGDVRVLNITFRDFKRWYEEFATPDEPGGRRMTPRAYDLIVQLKLIFRFGALALPKLSGCSDVCDILDKMEFAGGWRKRKEYLTYQQALLVCEEAHRRGWHSVAQAQAFMIECGLRQKDMIGEWVPQSEPGVTDVLKGDHKWLMGARWEEIDANFIWKHRLSKSVKGQNAIMDSEAGKTEEFDLTAFPMVRAELERIAPFERCNFPASGPIIVCELTGHPWSTSEFRRRWRQCAKGAGIPDNVQNRDSRSGAATEAELSGVPREKVKRLLGHSNEETTEGYQRASREIRSEIARMRAAKRKP